MIFFGLHGRSGTRTSDLGEGKILSVPAATNWAILRRPLKYDLEASSGPYESYCPRSQGTALPRDASNDICFEKKICFILILGTVTKKKEVAVVNI
ncbi:hypothetical protein RIF29_06951 [Crotalaria pallida]|uniref:Uncharacterized protein n=1 Tax=Crotalaria pallida TaxID=3830 RepID=A0AAN9J5A3_CROPI